MIQIYIERAKDKHTYFWVDKDLKADHIYRVKSSVPSAGKKKDVLTLKIKIVTPKRWPKGILGWL